MANEEQSDWSTMLGRTIWVYAVHDCDKATEMRNYIRYLRDLRYVVRIVNLYFQPAVLVENIPSENSMFNPGDCIYFIYARELPEFRSNFKDLHWEYLIKVGYELYKKEAKLMKFKDLPVGAVFTYDGCTANHIKIDDTTVIDLSTLDYWGMFSGAEVNMVKCHKTTEKNASEIAQEYIEKDIAATQLAESYARGDWEKYFLIKGPTKDKDKNCGVIFNDPATIVYWWDGTKTVVTCQPGDKYDPVKGLALCYMKKARGNKSGPFNKGIKMWVPEEKSKKPVIVAKKIQQTPVYQLNLEKSSKLTDIEIKKLAEKSGLSLKTIKRALAGENITANTMKLIQKALKQL